MKSRPRVLYELGWAAGRSRTYRVGREHTNDSMNRIVPRHRESGSSPMHTGNEPQRRTLVPMLTRRTTSRRGSFTPKRPPASTDSPYAPFSALARRVDKPLVELRGLEPLTPCLQSPDR
jgi:hypothetical protein